MLIRNKFLQKPSKETIMKIALLTINFAIILLINRVGAPPLPPPGGT
ncbi:MAG: hypothetical protein ACXAC8_17430 [Candidatus Hodarchaeales archaeon]|jgi:hypothetical protein